MIQKVLIAAAIIGVIVYSLSGSKPDAKVYLSQLHQFRSEKNRSFRQAPNSPLATTQKSVFDSLSYYPADLAFALEATVTRSLHPDTLLIQMSANRAEKYLHWGQATFTVANQPQRLSIYLSATGRDSTLFIPFTDLTNGHETYGGGRYLDVPLPESDATKITLDFNRAYNPYCAYNNEYSCPVPPAENRLQVAIPAGEKSFHD
ncbi:DUF1684 domain-containing protein [Hymenobacter rubidus]|uniref:DUF1684 domain-containing protein n=1 Tax=Hymenobacter rubidus TaxID=1441626 RepID=UPI00191E29EC|nr:DUF1684 domain-containing protein [Hymenobacter rubidus]